MCQSRASKISVWNTQQTSQRRYETLLLIYGLEPNVLSFFGQYWFLFLWTVGYDSWMIFPYYSTDYMGWFSLSFSWNELGTMKLFSISIFVDRWGDLSSNEWVWAVFIDFFFCMGWELWLQICVAYLQNVIFSLYGWNKIMLFFFGKKKQTSLHCMSHTFLWNFPSESMLFTYLWSYWSSHVIRHHSLTNSSKAKSLGSSSTC